MATIAMGEASFDDLDEELQALLEEGPISEKEQPPLTPTREAILREMAWAREQPWPGRSGTTDQLVYLAILDIAWKANTTIGLDLSLRRLTELTGIAVETVRRSRQRLVKKGMLKPVEKSKPEWHAPSFSLVLRNETHTLTTTDLLPYRLYVSRSATLPDAFRTSRGLSKTAYLVLSQLEDGRPQTAAELAKRTGKHRSTIGRALHQLGEWGLALQTPKGWRRQPIDLQRLAEELGTAGASEQARERNVQQRADFRRYLTHVGAE